MAPILTNAHKFVPDLTARIFAAQVRRDYFQKKLVPPTEGNLFAPMLEIGSISGGWKQK